MAQPAGPTPQQQAAGLFQQLETLYPNLAEPHKSNFSYAQMIAHDPSLDPIFCQAAGKTVHIIIKFSEKMDHPVAIRGEKGPLNWNTNRAANPQMQANFYQREFTMQVPKEQMNDTLLFKCVVPGRTPQEAMRWQTGDNCKVELKQFGHIAVVEFSGIKFA